MFEKYIDLIEKQGIDKKILADAIADHETKKNDMLKKYERYKVETTGVPILKREFDLEAANKINNKLANDFFSEIIDTKIGYVFGIPVTYALDKSTPRYEEIEAAISRFKKANNIDDLNGESGKFAAMCGYDGLLLYVDKEGYERVMRVDPWEVIIITNTEITEPKYGIRYYTKWDDSIRVEFYDDVDVTVFEGKSLALLEQVDKKKHMFDYCPLFGLPNNAELQGDADKVLTLIDGYDRSISDMNSEIEQFRLAYMLFIGYEPTQEALDDMRKMGAMYIPSAEDGEDIRFLTKELAHAAIDSHLDRLEANITRFSKHVNFTDAFGGGQVTGPAMRYKLFMLETKAIITERKHEAATMYMFKVLASAWKKKSIVLDHMAIDCQYTRNIPVNIVDEADAANKLLSLTSRRTALGTLSIVDDVDKEMERIDQEKAESIDLDNEKLLDDKKKNEE